MKTRQLTQWGIQIARVCDKSDRCQPGARLVNPRRRPIVPARDGLALGAVLQIALLLALVKQPLLLAPALSLAAPGCAGR